MNVTLCSAFRNASGYLDRYQNQVSELEWLLFQRGDRLSAIFCEGDSADNTWQMLTEMCSSDRVHWPCQIELFQCSHGGADYGSVVNAERFANLAKVWNAIWARIPEDTDAVLFVESDLIWEPATMLALLDDLEHMPVVAPLVLLRRDGWPADYFYDCWAFWRKGVQVRVTPPYFEGWDMQAPLPLDSAGSCIALRGGVASGLWWPPADVVRGLCREIRARGYEICLDAQQKVWHP